jgi:cell division protein FtsZ
VQINFGVILNESMADAVKITVIATGFQPEHAPVADRRSQPEIRFQPRLPQAAAASAPVPVPVVEEEPEPEPELEPELMADAEQMVDSEDIETPAYLRQGRLLN